ncbi:TioA protein, partial [Salmonella enterica]|nr:TioA protein [Salmonella enterica]
IKKMKLGVYNRRSENLNQKYLIYFLFNYCFVFLLRLNIKNIIVRVVGRLEV